MGDDQQRRPGGRHAREDAGERVLAGGVHAGGRLVHDQQLGLGGERPGDEHPALLAAGERGDRVLQPVGEADGRHGVGDGAAVGGAQPAEQAEPGQPADGDDLAHGRRHGAADRVPLRDVADAAALAQPADGGAEHAHLAGQHRGQAEQAPGERGLARAVGAEDGDGLAGARR